MGAFIMVFLHKISEIFKSSDCILNKKYRIQLFATLSLNIVILSHGITIGWLSPSLSKLQSTDSPLDFPININEASWIGGLVGLGSLAGNILFGLLLDFIGRKRSALLLALPQIGLWILVYTAKNVVYLYVGRFLGGVSGGGSYCVLSIFVSEIAETHIRGTLSSILLISLNAGILAGYIFGTYLQYHLIPLIVIVLPILYSILIFFFSETPYYLLRKGDCTAAENSFQFYRNFTKSNNCGNQQQHNRDFEELRDAVTTGKNQSALSYKDFFNKRVQKAFLTATVLLFVHQFCGTFAFVNYMSRIFEETQSMLDPNVSTIIIGCAQILGSYIATLFVDRFGRKILLLISCAGMSLTTLLFGIFTHFSKIYSLEPYSWVPLVLMVVFIFITNFGIIAVTFVIFVEIFPAKIRSIAISYCMAGISLMVFLILKIFPIYLHEFGISITMWSFSFVSFAGGIYFLIFLPETKGRSLTDDVN